jgi:hypothetical protein
VHLFRFLGCQLIFKLKEPPVRQQLQMLVIVPDAGTGTVTTRMKFLSEPGMTEIADSPVDLAPAGTEVDGRLRFSALKDLPEGAYTVECTVDQVGAIARVGTCSGTLNAPDLIVQLSAIGSRRPTCRRGSASSHLSSKRIPP